MKAAVPLVALLCFAPSAAIAAPIIWAELIHQGTRNTHALVFTGQYDVYTLYAHNPTDFPATSLELTLEGSSFLNLADRTFVAGAELPTVFGFETPDTFFVLPDGVDPADVRAVNVEDTSTRLSAAYTVAGGAELIPAMGSAPIATITVPSGTDVSNFRAVSPIGRAAVAGVLYAVWSTPEPTSAVLAGLALAAATQRRRS